VSNWTPVERAGRGQSTGHCCGGPPEQGEQMKNCPTELAETHEQDRERPTNIVIDLASFLFRLPWLSLVRFRFQLLLSVAAPKPVGSPKPPWRPADTPPFSSIEF